MRIGVIFAIYGCEDYVERCLTPWFNLRKKYDFVFTVTSGRFKDYADLGIPNKNKQTLRNLIEWDFDFMSVTGGEKLLDEDSSRNRCLDFLKPHWCDLIWLVDGDEFYTEEQIEKTIEWIQTNDEYDAFSLYLKNYTIKYPFFTDTWDRPTVYRNRKWGGIGRFYFDSWFAFADEEHGIKDLEIKKIPREICFVEHYSWLPTEAVKDKIDYQNKRYSGYSNEIAEGCRCSFEWGENGLDFSQTFWKCRGLQVPVLCEFTGPVTRETFQINFTRSENKFTVQADEHFENVLVSIGELNGRDYVGSFSIETLEPGVIYWYIPGTDQLYEDKPNTKGFVVKITQGNNLLHVANLHIKI